MTQKKPEFRRFKFVLSSMNYDIAGALDVQATNEKIARKIAEAAVREANKQQKDICLRIASCTEIK